MQVSVSYSEPGGQVWTSIELPEGSDVRAAIEKSGVLRQFPGIDLERQRVGVFGRLSRLDTVLRAGDRVEIYRAIVCDPHMAQRGEAE